MKKIRFKKLTCGCHRVDTLGNVWTRMKNRYQLGSWRIMSLPKDIKGRPRIHFHGKTENVLRLIAKAFIKNPKKYKLVLHGNGNPSDNRVENLRWGTWKMNADDKEKHGKTCRGESVWCSKLSNEKVREIRRMVKEKIPHKYIGEIFGITKGYVSKIGLGVYWKHVK